jgi:hypothetical protein
MRRVLTLIISGSIDAMDQINLRTSRGNRGKNVRSSSVLEAEVGIELAALLKDNEEREKEAIAMTECSSLFVYLESVIGTRL